ncbi:unnamed protein product [Didymodactylos carnosus]|uniref:Uncharacterized protein n=1 Tax=Didymodactylos carnosus TaxID=1234261 RepID=A0A8S2JRG2_9BILA|nr:unnamed protein product [Didymodactylos carnosus]CAF3819939.1 unnamed protein product [Didymodactylos carnosus]
MVSSKGFGIPSTGGARKIRDKFCGKYITLPFSADCLRDISCCSGRVSCLSSLGTVPIHILFAAENFETVGFFSLDNDEKQL